MTRSRVPLSLRRTLTLLPTLLHLLLALLHACFTMLINLTRLGLLIRATSASPTSREMARRVSRCSAP